MFYCQIRGHLLRDFFQPAPKPDLPKVEHSRRDIWWVDGSEAGAAKAIESAARVIDHDLQTRLRQLSDHRYLLRYLYWCKESDRELYGFGVQGSPARRRIINILAERVPCTKWLKWRLLLPSWLDKRLESD